MSTINALAKVIYEQNKSVGWWDDPNRCTYQTLQLVSTEIAEATEGERKNLMDDHLPHRAMGEVELADTLIRLLDLAGRYDWEFKQDGGYYIASYLHSTPTIAGKHFVVNIPLSKLGEALLLSAPKHRIDEHYTALVRLVLRIASDHGYDVMGALHEKFEYNKNRADHKREARALDGGKKF